MAAVNGRGKRGGRFLAVVLSAALLFAVSAVGAPVSVETAEGAAREYLERKPGGGELKIRRVASRSKARAAAPYFVFEKEGGGFVVVSADDAAAPVLGETGAGVFDKGAMPPALVWLLGTYERQIEEAVKSGGARGAETDPRWKQTAQSSAAAAVSYPLKLLSTAWSQREPYNLKAPLDGSERSAAGCVAVALAQIMKYWRHPAYGTGASAAYKTVPKNISIPSVSFNTYYDYDEMLDNYTAGSGTAAQRDAVATLMYHCGVSVKMNYTSDESGALPTNVASALTQYFGYDACIRNITTGLGGVTVSASDWKDLIIGQIENNSPVYYNGVDADGVSAHAFVIDGYDGGSGMFHVNWGWGGAYDGFFALTALNPGAYRYNELQGMVINIMPNQGGNPPSLIKVSGFDVSVTETAVSADIRAKMNYGADFSGKIGFAAMSGGAVGMVLDSADYSVSNTYIALLGIYAVNYKTAKLGRQFGADMPRGSCTLRVVTKRGAGAWTPVGDAREIFVPEARAADSGGGTTPPQTGVRNVTAADRAAGAARSGVEAPAAPVNILTAEFTAGPNPAGKSSGVIKFFRNGSRIAPASLSIYNSAGGMLKKITVSDNAADGGGRRMVGSWNLTDAKGRSVPAGTYLVKGAVKTAGGRREPVSVTVSVR